MENKKIPKKLLELGYKHIPEEELIKEYNSLPENYTMYNVSCDFNEETLEFKHIRSVEFGIYLKELRKLKLEKLNEKIYFTCGDSWQGLNADPHKNGS